MANIIDLDDFGKRISEDFISNKTNMTEALLKVAKDNGLNKQQVNRVAETANVEAYLALMKTANDKYLSFPVADPKAVHVTMVKESSHSSISAYNNAPQTDASISEIFGAYNKLDKSASWSSPVVVEDTVMQVSLCKEAEAIILDSDATVSERLQRLSDKRLIKEATKEASFRRDGKQYVVQLNPASMDIMRNGGSFKNLKVKGYIKETIADGPTKSSEIKKLANVHRGSIELVKNEFNVFAGKVLSEVDNLYNLSKQACLSGNTPSEINNVITSAMPIIGDVISDVILQKLAEEASHLNYEVTKTAEVVNTDSDIYKSAKSLEEGVVLTARLEIALDQLYEKYANFTKDNDYPNVLRDNSPEYISDFVKTAVSAVKAVAKEGLGTGPLVAALVGANLLGRQSGKVQGKREQGRLLQEVMLNVGTPKKRIY